MHAGMQLDQPAGCPKALHRHCSLQAVDLSANLKQECLHILVCSNAGILKQHTLDSFMSCGGMQRSQWHARAMQLMCRPCEHTLLSDVGSQQQASQTQGARMHPAHILDIVMHSALSQCQEGDGCSHSVGDPGCSQSRGRRQ